MGNFNFFDAKVDDYSFNITFFLDDSYDKYVDFIVRKEENIIKTILIPARNLKTIVAWCNNFIEKFTKDEDFKDYVLRLDDKIVYTSIKKMPVENLNLNKDVQNLIELESKNIAKFKDYANLKSGRDKYSRMKYDALKSLISTSDFNVLKEEFHDDASIASAIRWLLRGLPLKSTIHKLNVDKEVIAGGKIFR